MSLSDLESTKFWLQQAKFFNKEWHVFQDLFINSELSRLSESEKSLFNATRKTLLTQKINAQITALNLAYSQFQHNLVLEIDSSELGMSGEGIFYSLYPKDSFELACHIPREDLFRYLTDKQRVFFDIT